MWSAQSKPLFAWDFLEDSPSHCTIRERAPPEGWSAAIPDDKLKVAR